MASNQDAYWGLKGDHPHESSMQSGQQHKRHWDFVRSQEPSPKKMKIDVMSKGEAMLDDACEHISSWYWDTVVADKELPSTHPVKILMYNLECELSEAFERAAKKFKALKVIKQIKAAKPAVMDEKGLVEKDPQYLVSYEGGHFEDEWIEMKKVSDDNPLA